MFNCQLKLNINKILMRNIDLNLKSIPYFEYKAHLQRAYLKFTSFIG